MSTQRYISTSFWDDTWISELSKTEKLLYLYLLTNTLTNIAGVYKISVARMSFDTGISREEVTTILNRFDSDGKAIRHDEYIILPMWPKHQVWDQRSKVKIGIISVLKQLPRGILEHLSTVGYAFPLELVDSTIVGYLARVGISGSQKKRIVERDNGKCKRCGSSDKLHLHHILPVSEGGTNSDDNLETICESCHVLLHKEDVHIPYEDVRNYLDIDPNLDVDQSILSGKPDIVPFHWEVLDYLNQKAGRQYKRVHAHANRIKARISEGYTLEDFKKVIDFKVSEWMGKDDFEQYLRPETIFGTKFDSYLAQAKPRVDPEAQGGSAQNDSPEFAEMLKAVKDRYANLN